LTLQKFGALSTIPFVKGTTPANCLVAATGLLLLISGCSGNTSLSDSNSTVVVGKEGRPDVPVPVGPPPKKLIVEDLKEGSGPPAKAGDELSVRYFNLAYKSHRLYEDSWSELPPPFLLGGGQRVEAWEKGLPGVKAGGRRELIVPGGRTTLGHAPEIYVVDVLSIRPTNRSGEIETPDAMRGVKGTGPKPKLHFPNEPPRHVVARVIKEGAGPTIRPGERLTARYVGANPRTKLVQDFWSEDRPYRFRLGENRLGKAWGIGLKGMRLGGRREVIVPSRLAYGDGMMVYVIELLEMEKRKPGRTG
jgi:FKBP-type peptidyl-prolyl cis-trans isomerase